MFSIDIEIGDQHIEPPYMHVHHAQSLVFLEKARAAFVSHVGFPLEWFFAQELFLVVTAIDVRYKREVSIGHYQATCENAHEAGKAVILEQRLLNAKGKTAVAAKVEIMCLSGTLRRAVTMPEAFVRAFLGEEGAATQSA